MVTQVMEKAGEYFSILVQKQVLQRHLFLLIEQLFHDLEEVAAEDGQRVVIFVQELAQRFNQRVVVLGLLRLFRRFRHHG